MRPFSYNTSAELFPAAIRKKKRPVSPSAFWHRGRSGSLRDRGIAGGLAECAYLAGRGSPLRPERHPLAL